MVHESIVVGTIEQMTAARTYDEFELRAYGAPGVLRIAEKTVGIDRERRRAKHR
jgi:hypothetical protein